jgi:hypothetical protein
MTAHSTQIPLSTFTSGADLNDAGTAIDVTNGMYVDLTTTAVPSANGSEDLLLYITNTAGSTKTVTVKAGVGGGVTPGAAIRSGLGDFVTGNLSATTGTAFIGPFDSTRFMQSNGRIYLDFAASMTGNIWALLIPSAPQI